MHQTLRRAGTEARLGTVTLGGLPLVVALLRTALDPGFPSRLATSALGVAAAVAALLLAVVGVAWLWRIASPPFSARPSRWRAYRDVAARTEAVVQGLDRARRRAERGAGLRQAVEDGFAADSSLRDRVLALLDEGPAPATSGDTPRSQPGWVTVLQQAPATASADRVLTAAEDRFSADWRRVVATRSAHLSRELIVPFMVCVLPACILVAVVAQP